MEVRIYCDRCNHGLSGNTDDPKYGKEVVDMMILHRKNSQYLLAHQGMTKGTVYFPRWVITFKTK